MSKKIPIKKFSFRTIVFSIVIAGLSALFQLLCPNYATPALPYIVLFFFVITLFTIFIVLRDDNGKSGKRFVSSYMLSRIIKLMSCLLFLGIYLFINRKDSLRFGIAFLVIYFLYSIFELFILKRESDDIKKRDLEKNKPKEIQEQ